MIDVKNTQKVDLRGCLIILEFLKEAQMPPN